MCKIMYCDRCRWRQPDSAEEEQTLPVHCPHCGQIRGMHFLEGTLDYLIDHWPKVRAQMIRCHAHAITMNPITRQNGPTHRR